MKPLLTSRQQVIVAVFVALGLAVQAVLWLCGVLGEH